MKRKKNYMSVSESQRHWKPTVVIMPTLSSLVPPQVVIMITWLQSWHYDRSRLSVTLSVTLVWGQRCTNDLWHLVTSRNRYHMKYKEDHFIMFIQGPDTGHDHTNVTQLLADIPFRLLNHLEHSCTFCQFSSAVPGQPTEKTTHNWF